VDKVKLLRRVALSAVFLLVLMIPVHVVLGLNKTEVTGTATCQGNLEPAGFWIHAGDDSGYVSWKPVPGSPNTATFTREITWLAVIYGWRVDVGCGKQLGEPEEWQSKNIGSTIRGTTVELTCQTPPPPYPSTEWGKCVEV
jgi:hypothetical protein